MAKLITGTEMKKLLANGAKQNADATGKFDARPVVKLFNPYGNQTWLISEVDPTNPDTAYGLCDMGSGTPELGSVSISELTNLRVGPGRRLPIERDRHFTADKLIGEYARDAREKGRIVA